MSNDAELLIRDMLIAEKNSDHVAISLAQRLKNNEYDGEELFSFLTFIINSGHFNEALDALSTIFDKKNPVPLNKFCELLFLAGYKPGRNFLKNIFTANKKLADQFQIKSFPPWEKYDQNFTTLRTHHLSHFIDIVKKRKDELISKLEYFRANRMIAEEDKLLNQLIELYPEDNQFLADKHKHKERWARSVIAKKSFETFDKGFEQTEPLFTAEEMKIAKMMSGEVKALAQKKPHHAYNLALLLFSLELYEDTKDVLSFAKTSLSADWFYLDVLIKCRRFVECLDAISNIEIRYASDPETIFGTTYYRALSLIGLGQSSTAIELLKSIVTIRPNYRSAHTLLYKISGGVL